MLQFILPICLQFLKGAIVQTLNILKISLVNVNKSGVIRIFGKILCSVKSSPFLTKIIDQIVYHFCIAFTHHRSRKSLHIDLVVGQCYNPFLLCILRHGIFLIQIHRGSCLKDEI